MPEVVPGRYLVQAGWDDAPHLTEKMKTELLRPIPRYQRGARTKGLPMLGKGAIYPIDDDEVRVQPFAIPASWPRCYVLDVGWKKTAALWTAWNPADGVAYHYSEYYRGRLLPSVHASAVKARGEWVPGGVDPAANGASQADGERLLETYGGLGLNLTPMRNEVDTGISLYLEMMVNGMLKVFSTCTNWFAEKNIYRSNDKGVVKENDHLMDCGRMTILSGREIAKSQLDARLGQRATSGGGRRVADRHAGI